jgi:hypothetical protein
LLDPKKIPGVLHSNAFYKNFKARKHDSWQIKNHEVRQMPQDHRCVLCDEAITNPLCLRCMEKEVSSWVVDIDPMLLCELKEITSSFRGYTKSTDHCVMCGKHLTVCSHCYYTEVKDILKSNVPAEAEVLLWPLDER